MKTSEWFKLLEDGERLRVDNWDEGSWIEMRDGLIYDENNNEEFPKDFLPIDPDEEWEVVKKPVKYSKVLWLSEIPNARGKATTLVGHLFGNTELSWGYPNNPLTGKHKYKITIEEVETNHV